MLSDIMHNLPFESCGLVAGVRCDQLWEAQEIIPVKNVLKNSTRFRMSPQEQLEAFQTIEDNGWELLAIYHSHPSGPPIPSPTDLEEHFYPDTLALICSYEQQRWVCKAFQVSAEIFKEVEIQIG